MPKAAPFDTLGFAPWLCLHCARRCARGWRRSARLSRRVFLLGKPDGRPHLYAVFLRSGGAGSPSAITEGESDVAKLEGKTLMDLFAFVHKKKPLSDLN